MPISNLVTATESGKVGLGDTMSIDPTPFCRVSLSNNHKTSKYQQIKNLTTFIFTRSRNFKHWLNRREGKKKQPYKSVSYRQYYRNGWHSHSRSPSSNQGMTCSTGSSNNSNNNTRYTLRSVQPLSIQTGSRNKRRGAKRWTLAI